MARKIYFLIWILSAAALGFLAFMPDYMGRGLYTSVFPAAFYQAHAGAIPMLGHAAFFFLNCLCLFLLLNTSRQIGESGKFIIVCVWASLLTVVSEVGQMYIVPESYNRSGLNIRDAMADFSGFIVAWLFYLFFVKLIYGSRMLKRNYR